MGENTISSKPSLQKNERRISFDILRIFATLGVIVLHASSTQWKVVEYNTYEWNVLTVYDSLVRWAVPAFVMISGALFLNAEHSLKRIYTKYIFRIFTAFVFWSALYTLYDYHEKHDLKKAVLLFFRGYYHLWFLFMIVGLYMIIPFLKKIIKDRRLTRYFLVLAFVFSFLLPEAVFILSKLDADVGKYAKAALENMHLEFVVGYTFFFVIGYVLSKIEINNKQLIALAFLGIIGVGATAFLTYKFSHFTDARVKQFFDEMTVNVLLQGVFVFALFLRLDNIRLGEKAKHIIFLLSKYSFGVYLVHMFIILLLEKLFDFTSVSVNPVIGVPAVSIITFTVSYEISAVLNNIPILKKYIV